MVVPKALPNGSCAEPVWYEDALDDTAHCEGIMRIVRKRSSFDALFVGKRNEDTLLVQYLVSGVPSGENPVTELQFKPRFSILA